MICIWSQVNSLNLSARALHASTVKTVLGDESVPFFPLFSFILMTSMQLVYPLERAEGWHENEDTHVYVSDAEEQHSCYKYSSAVFFLHFNFIIRSRRFGQKYCSVREH